jgi:hypothetical protein
MSKVAIPKNLNECNALLKEIEHELIDLFPQAVRREKIKEPAYGMLICYIDLTTNAYTPFAAILPESHRVKCVANREVDHLWSIAELPKIECFLPTGGTIHGMCDAVYGFLSADWDDEYTAILPFRKMIYRVCLSLNKLDWSRYLPVTDDFTVMASDWSAGFYIGDEANASVPAGKKKRLLEKGFFFNPQALPKESLAPGSQIKSIGKRTLDEQVEFWVSQLEAFHNNARCEAKDSNLGVKRVVQRLAKLEAAGANAMLQFLEQKVGLPEWTAKQPPTSEWMPGSRTETLVAVIEGLKQTCSPSAENERKLWKAFETAVKINQKAEFWGVLPAQLAFCIQDIFRVDGRWKYDYWVVRDFRNQLTSLAEIRKQRRELGPK